MQTDKVILCRQAPSIGKLEEIHEEIWGTIDFDVYHSTEKDTLPCVFFGLYGLNDFHELWKHKGKKWILWAGSDIRHFLKGYWLDEHGQIRIHATQLAPWIDTYCESYVENDLEKAALGSVGIRAKVVPSFLGDTTKFDVSFFPSEKPKLYTSVSGDDFRLYGWDKIPEIAKENPDAEFHLYGNTIAPYFEPKELAGGNIFIHGRVPAEQMNEEIKHMQGALRMTEFDGFSEIIAKSLLMGQYPVSAIDYLHTLNLDEIGKIKKIIAPNMAGRKWVLDSVNKFPWNQNLHV